MHEELDQLRPTERFSSRAEHYAKYRPGYPREVVTLLSQQMGLTPDSMIADVGSGTGILCKLFLENGNAVLGIEPNRQMRLAGERLLAGFAKFQSIEGTAESIPLPNSSVHGVVCGQAFHWFEQEKAAAEFRRISRPGGFVALIWNVRRTDASAFM